MDIYAMILLLMALVPLGTILMIFPVFLVLQALGRIE